MTRTLSILILVFATGSLARAIEITRVLKTFDFEERRLGNDEDLPMHWTKVRGPGLPHYVNGKLSTDRQHGGQYSFRFDLNGGGLIYRYQPGLIKVQQGARYRIDGYCQTTPLPNARARITAYFVDLDGHVVDGSVHHSELYAAQLEDDVWKKLGVSIAAESPKADSLVIELEVLQPSQYTTGLAAEHALFEQDIRGSVWWDDVTVSQVPTVALRTDHVANIFRREETVRVGVFVSDRSTDDLMTRVSVVDAAGTEVYQRTGTPQATRDTSVSGQQKRMLLELPPMLPGWYQVKLKVSSQGRALQSAKLSFIILAERGQQSPPDVRFGFDATDLPFDVVGELSPALAMLSGARVKLAVWDEQGGVDPATSAQFDRVLIKLGGVGISPTACLLTPPSRLTERLKGGGWARLLKLKTEEWQPDLAFLVSRQANHMESWQMGRDGTDAFVNDPEMRQVYQGVYHEFSQLMNKPDLAMPWPAWYELPNDLPAGVAVSVPPSILPSQLPLYIQDVQTHTDHAISLRLQPLDRARYGREVQVRDLAQRIIYALSAGAKRIDLPLPITATHDELGDSTEPGPLFVVMRTLFSTLSGSQFKGRIQFGDGIEGFLFDREGEGIIALWSRGDTIGTQELAVNLGDRPVSIDMWGNATPLMRSRAQGRGGVTLSVGPMPIFLVDIDGPQAQLRASVSVDQPALESAFRPHPRRVRFVNPYPKAITGTLHLKGPQGWTLNPPTFTINLNPGEKFDQPFTIQFPYNSVAGQKTINCDFLLSGETNPTFNVPLAMRLGLSDVGMQTIALRDGRDVFVEQTITNYGDKQINYSAFAMYANQPRQERLVVNLGPGVTTIRKYRFSNVSPTQTSPVRVGLKELQGERVLNDSVEVR
jgi:hypothetical protein